MTDLHIYIGYREVSSWSLRAWMPLRKVGLPFEETLIRAPFDGQVTDRRIVPGQHNNVSEPLFTLVDFEPLRVRIHLPEVVARKVRPGDEVEVVVEALTDPVDAVVERISPVVDPTTSTVKQLHLPAPSCR